FGRTSEAGTFYLAGTATSHHLPKQRSRFISIGPIAVTPPMERAETPWTLTFNMTSPGATARILCGVSDIEPRQTTFVARSEYLSILPAKPISFLAPSCRTKLRSFPEAYILR